MRTRTLSLTRRLPVAAALAAAGVLALSQTASANTGQIYTQTSGGYGDWADDTEALSVCDMAADGYGVRAYVYIPSASDETQGTVLLKASDPKSGDACAHASKNLSGYTHISLKVCEYAGSWVGDCTSFRDR
ncbi:hypothetical protein ABZ915_08615 [Streptomyces sp. NPDC046915]|uniref:hypothetical protein n=1 Tax=Streptomyces sp. NPDC046915 TaxID=3155257 RepID=UPI0033F666A5